MGVNAELVVLAGENGVEEDADDGGDGKAGQAHRAEAQGAGGTVLDAEGEHEDQRGDDDVAGVGEVDLVLNHVAHTDGGDHTVEHEADAADGRGGHGGNERGELRAEAQHDRKDGGDADDARVIDLGECKHAGVLAVGGVGRRAKQGGERRGKTVAHEGAVQAGVREIVALDGGGNGADIADVLHHGRDGERDDRDNGGDDKAAVGRADKGEDRGLPVDGDTDPVGGGDGGDNSLTGGGVNDHGENIGGDDAEKDGDDLDHAPAPHVADDDDNDGDDGDQKIRVAVVNGRGGERKADGDDDGPGHDGREKAHDLLEADALDDGGEDHIHEAGDRDGKAGVRQKLRLAVRGDGPVAREVREGRAEEGRDAALRDQVEEQRAEAGEEQRRGDVEPGQRGDKHGRAEHGEHVLQAEDEHLRRAECASVVNRFVADGFLVHSIYLSL